MSTATAFSFSKRLRTGRGTIAALVAVLAFFAPARAQSPLLNFPISPPLPQQSVIGNSTAPLGNAQAIPFWFLFQSIAGPIFTTCPTHQWVNQISVPPAPPLQNTKVLGCTQPTLADIDLSGAPASNGGVVWSDASKLNILANTTTANLPLLSGATATPTWATISYPTSATSGGIPYFSSSSAMASSAALAANQIVVGGGAGSPPVTGTGCSISNSSVICATSASLFPQFQLRNTTADANGPAFIFQKQRAGGNTLTSDAFADFEFQGFANSASSISGRLQFIQTGSSSGNNIPSKFVLSTSDAAGQIDNTFVVDQASHVSNTQNTAPSLTAGCNGAGSSVTGTDMAGTVTGQTSAATSCTLTFGTAYAAAPNCTVSGLSSPLTGAVTIGTGTLVVNFGSTANFKWTYVCHGA